MNPNITNETVTTMIVQFTIYDNRGAMHVVTAYMVDDDITVLDEDGEAAIEPVAAVARQRLRQLARPHEAIAVSSHTSVAMHGGRS